MIQFNLLPDVKLQYIRAKRLKHTMVTVSGVTIVACLTITVVLFMGVQVFQKRHINNINKDIKKYRSELEGTKDLDKLLTIQNQLSSLSDMHSKKPIASRYFLYLSQITPKEVTVSDTEVDFATGTIKITGSTSEASAVNKFVDTIKFTTFSASSKDGDGKEQTETGDAFSEVTLTNQSRGEKDVTYEINLKYNPMIFDVNKTVSLVVPSTISSRSTTEKPSADSDIFKQKNKDSEQ